MNITVSNFKNYWADVPNNVRNFLLKAFICFIIWKVSYHTYIKPHRIFDVPLTQQTASSTKRLLQLFYPKIQFIQKDVKIISNNDFYGISIFASSKKVVAILDPCNALELYVLYALFIVCLPSNFIRMIAFVIIGIASIFLLNICRCAVLGILNMHRSLYVDFAHHYLFTMVVYIAVFSGWALYINKSLK